MKPLLIALIFCFEASFGQTYKSIYIKEFGCTIKMPTDFKIMDEDSVASMKKRTEKYLNDPMIDVVGLLSAKKNEDYYFVLDYSISSQITSGNWKRINNEQKEIWLNTLGKSIPVKPDTATSIVVYDGVEFINFKINFKLNENTTVYIVYLNTFQKGHYFTLNYLYVDDFTGKEIMNILKTLKFDK